MHKGDFFSEFLKEGKNIGSITPSSKYLVKKMIEPIDFSNVKCIVEFGPGTGNITLELLKKMPDDSFLLAFETNAEFCEKLHDIKDPRLKIICDTAEKLEDYLLENNIQKADYIVSSLPFAMIPNNIVKNILSVVTHVLKPGGAFIQFQYSLNAYKKLRDTFKNVDLTFTPMNIPPAFIFTCTN